MQTERWVATNSQTKPTDLGCESADKRLLPSTSIIAICYYYSARKLTAVLNSFYHLMKGGTMSQPRHCSKGVQPCPRLYYHSGCRVRHNCQRPLTLQPCTLPLDHCNLWRQMGMNNLPKVVTRLHCGWESNSQPSSCKSNAITTRLPNPTQA